MQTISSRFAGDKWGEKELEFICLLLVFPLGRQGVAVERQVLLLGLSMFQIWRVLDSQPLQGTVFNYM